MDNKNIIQQARAQTRLNDVPDPLAEASTFASPVDLSTVNQVDLLTELLHAMREEIRILHQRVEDLSENSGKIGKIGKPEIGEVDRVATNAYVSSSVWPMEPATPIGVVPTPSRLAQGRTTAEPRPWRVLQGGNEGTWD